MCSDTWGNGNCSVERLHQQWAKVWYRWIGIDEYCSKLKEICGALVGYCYKCVFKYTTLTSNNAAISSNALVLSIYHAISRRANVRGMLNLPRRLTTYPQRFALLLIRENWTGPTNLLKPLQDGATSHLSRRPCQLSRINRRANIWGCIVSLRARSNIPLTFALLPNAW